MLTRLVIDWMETAKLCVNREAFNVAAAATADGHSGYILLCFSFSFSKLGVFLLVFVSINH